MKNKPLTYLFAALCGAFLIVLTVALFSSETDNQQERHENLPGQESPSSETSFQYAQSPGLLSNTNGLAVEDELIIQTKRAPPLRQREG